MKCVDSLTLKVHNSFQNIVIENTHTVLVPDLSETDIVTIFLNLENRSFENVSFSPQ